jgi:DNA-binding beta-propeller fold protein YncE
MFRIIALTLLATALTVTAQAQTGDCNAPASSPSVTLTLPAAPFMVVPSQDGCWVFVSLTGRGENSGIAVLKRSAGKIDLVRVVPFPSSPTGIALTHDGKLLIGAATNLTVIADVKKMTEGAPDAVAGSIPGGRGNIYANTTDDDKLLFVAEESGQSIDVIDLERARRNGYAPDAVIGKVPVGLAPIALTLSPDNKWLYTTSQLALPDWNWPKACKPEGAPVPDSVITNPEGAVIVIDVTRAKTDPAHAVAARVPAGCSPVRMTSSPKGDRIYVSARNSNAVLEFDTAKLVSDGAHAMVGIAPVGDAPVPVMTVDKGRRLLVGNSNRFAGRGEPQSLTVLDTAKISQGLAAVQGIIPAGSFPREMAVSSDRRTLFLTNFGSSSLQVLDIDHLPIDPKLPPEIAKNADSVAHRHDHKPIEVDPKVLARYVGVYRASPTQIAIIGMDGNQLTAKLGPPPQVALPESDTKFFVLGLEIEFPKVAEGGHADQFTQSQGDRVTILKRVDDETAKPILAAAAAQNKRMKDNTPFPGSEEALRQLIASAQSGKSVDTMLAPDAQQFIPQFQQQAAQMGTVKSIRFQAVGPAGPDIYQIEGEKGTWMGRIWMAADGKVERVMAQPMNLGSNSIQSVAAPSPANTQKALAVDASYAAAAAADTGNASAAKAYATQAAGMGAQGETRSAASAAASAADTAAAAVETAAAAVESDASKASAASAAGDRAAANAARAQAVEDYSALQAADAQLAKAAADLATAAAANVAFYGGATARAGAINDVGAQDASAAANLVSAVTKGGSAGYSAAAANEAAAIKDANSIADAVPSRATAFRAAATAEAAAQAAAIAATAGGSASAAAAALLAAANAGATADGSGNPFAGAVETAAAAVAHAVSATIASQQTMNRLKALQ